MRASQYLAMIGGNPSFNGFSSGRGGVRPNRFGMSDLSGSKSRAMFAAATAVALAQADKISSEKLATGEFVQLPSDINWAFEPNGDISKLYWLGTGSPGNHLAPAAPAGYQEVPGSPGVRVWRGSGVSPVQKVINAAQAAYQAQATAVAQQQQASAQAQAQQAALVAQAQAQMNSAITQANSMARLKQFDQALQVLQNAQLSLAGVDTTALTNAINTIQGQVQQAQTDLQTQNDSRAALDDALAAARRAASRGQFDQADEYMSEANKYVRSLPVTAKSDVRQVQDFIDGSRDRLEKQAQAKVAQDAALAAQQAQAQREAELRAQIAQTQADAEARRLQAQTEAEARKVQAELDSKRAEQDARLQAMQMQFQMQQAALQQQQASQATYGGGQVAPAGGLNLNLQYQQQYQNPAQQVDQGYNYDGSPAMAPPSADYSRYADPSSAPVSASPSPQGVASDYNFAGDAPVSDESGGDFMGDYYGLSGMAEAAADAQKETRAKIRLGASKQKRVVMVVGGLVLAYLFKDKIKKLFR